MKISLTDPKKMRMMIRDEIFNFNSLVLKMGISSIPVTEFDPSVASVPIGVPGIKIAVRQN